MNADTYSIWKDKHFYIGCVLCALITPLGGAIYMYFMMDRKKETNHEPRD